MMNLSKIFGIGVLLITVAFLAACQKEMPALETPVSDPILPPLTHEGKNTFGCLIDGEPFVAEVDYAFAGPVAVWGTYNEDNGYFAAQGTRSLDNDALDDISVKTIIDKKAGNYDMFFTTENYVGYAGYGSGTGCWFYHDLNNKGIVEITYLDTLNDIISGKFEMELINPDCPTKQGMSVTDGRFDIRY